MSQGNEVKSVAKALRLLELLSDARQPLSLTELHQRTGWPRSTIFGLLSTMREFRVVSQWSDGRYALGLRLFEFGCSAGSVWDITAVARPYLQRLAARAGGSAVLSVCDGGHVMALDQAEGHGGLRVVVELGMELPLHATSQGKLFLSALGQGAAHQLLEGRDLTLYTPHTITDPDTLYQELEQIRAQGYAVEDGEYKIGLRSVSAPVWQEDGRMGYAVTVVGMFRRVRSEEFQQIIAETVETVRALSSALSRS